MTTSLASVTIPILASAGFGAPADVSHLSPTARTYSFQQAAPPSGGWTVDLWVSTESAPTDYSLAWTFSASSAGVFTVPDASYSVKANTRIVGQGSTPTCSVSALDITTTPGVVAGNAQAFGAGEAPPAGLSTGLWLAGELGVKPTAVANTSATYTALDTDTLLIVAAHAGGTTITLNPTATGQPRFLWVYSPTASPPNPVTLSYSHGFSSGSPTTWAITKAGGWIVLEISDSATPARFIGGSFDSEAAQRTASATIKEWERFVPIDFTAAGAIVGTLPAGPLDGETHTFYDVTGTAQAGHTLSVAGNGYNVNGVATLTSAIATAWGAVTVRFSSFAGQWTVLH